MKLDHVHYIGVEGMIGAGKLELAERLAGKLNGRTVLDMEFNPFLSDYYNFPERYALQTQLAFLISRYNQQMHLSQTDLFSDVVISDYLFAKDRLYAYLTLNEREFVLYNSIYSLMEKETRRPDLVIYLRTSVSMMIQNNLHREDGSAFDAQYLKKLNQAYNQFFLNFKECPLLVINTDGKPLPEEDLSKLVDRIAKPFSGTLSYEPSGQKTTV